MESNQIGKDYWNRRMDMMYYKYVNALVKGLAFNAESIIDIGSANTSIIEDFFWIPNKYTLDINNPYKSKNIVSYEMDFFDFNPEKKSDFAICLQVLEHIEDVEKFAQKLLEISDRILISVPYNWPENADSDHIHDPIDESKLLSWFGIKPKYSMIVTEPFRYPQKGISKRIINYYSSVEEEINYKEAKSNFEKLNAVEDKRRITLHNVEDDIKQVKLKIDKIMVKQNENFNKMFGEIRSLQMENELIKLIEENNKKAQKVLEIERKIAEYNSKIEKSIEERKVIDKEILKVKASTSWKMMSPIRLLGKIFK